MWHMDGDWGWWMAAGWIWMLLFWGLIAGAIVAVLHRTGAFERSSDAPAEPLRILEERYARGEIDDDEFERRRQHLANGSRGTGA